MSPLEVLAVIRQHGGSVVVVDGDLKIKAPPGLLSGEQRAVLLEHKAVLVRLLFDPDREERDAIQREDEPPIEGGWDFPEPRPFWWSEDMTDDENEDLDEFMEYGGGGPETHERCFKCGGKGWTWHTVYGRPRASCPRCKSFIGYGRQEVTI